MEYGTVLANNSIILDDRVNKLIAKGWIPLGGVSVSATPHANSATEFFYAQAMIRELEPTMGKQE